MLLHSRQHSQSLYLIPHILHFLLLCLYLHLVLWVPSARLSTRFTNDLTAASRCILVWAWASKKCPQKDSCNTFSIYISLKTKWNIVYKYLKTKNIFKRPKYPSPNALNTKYFRTLGYNLYGFFGITELPNFIFKKTVCPKNLWWRHWTLP